MNKKDAVKGNKKAIFHIPDTSEGRLFLKLMKQFRNIRCGVYLKTRKPKNATKPTDVFVTVDVNKGGVYVQTIHEERIYLEKELDAATENAVKARADLIEANAKHKADLQKAIDASAKASENSARLVIKIDEIKKLNTEQGSMIQRKADTIKELTDESAKKDIKINNLKIQIDNLEADKDTWKSAFEQEEQMLLSVMEQYKKTRRYRRRKRKGLDY